MSKRYLTWPPCSTVAAKLAGIAQSGLSRYESAKGSPGFLRLDKLGKVYGGITVKFGSAGTVASPQAAMVRKKKLVGGKMAAARRRSA